MHKLFALFACVTLVGVVAAASVESKVDEESYYWILVDSAGNPVPDTMPVPAVDHFAVPKRAPQVWHENCCRRTNRSYHRLARSSSGCDMDASEKA